MTTKITAQLNLNGGSFIIALVGEGHLVKNALYRVKSVKQEGKYVVLDETFCGTVELKDKSLTFANRFALINEDDVKVRFKELLLKRCFVNGQTFTDVRTGHKVTIDADSRTHVLTNFGKFIGVKIAGGNVWFVGKNWAKSEVTMPTKEEVETPTEETKQRKTVDMMKGSLEEQIFAVVDEHLDSDEALQHMSNSVEKLLNKWGIDKNVRQLEVTIDKAPPVKVGKIHFKFDLVLKCMMARTNIALVGAAGSGKTTTVSKAAEALKLKFFSKSVSAQTGAHEFFGYQDAQGRYVRTLFREAYEFGGVFLLDEFDAGNPNVLAALNQATANEHCAFADDMIAKHDDFICVMAGNTFGHGANSEYVGRNRIDAATLDRFAFIDFPYDEDLEHALASNKAWCNKVQTIRKKVAEKKIRTVVSPRATIIGGQLLANGITEAEVMELLIYKGMNQEERNLLK